MKFKDQNKKIKPRTFFDELAEYGYLEDYLNTYFSDKFENDQLFREEMLGILLRKSKVPVAELDRIHLEKLSETLSYFLEYTSECRKHKQ